MSHHTVTILQKSYNISCSDTEVPHLQKCTDFVNDVLRKITKNCKTGSENTLMAMALLVIADELLEYKNNKTEKKETENLNNIIINEVIPQDMITKLENLCQQMKETAQENNIEHI